MQRLGSWLTTRPIRWKWPVSFTDLGPPRIIRREALECLALRDGNFGWNVGTQARAARLCRKVTETLVNYDRRRFGKWEISGTVVRSGAGAKILWTMCGSWRRPGPVGCVIGLRGYGAIPRLDKPAEVAGGSGVLIFSGT